MTYRIILYLFFSWLVLSLKAQEAEFNFEKLSLSEQKAYALKKAFKESSGYNKTDFVYQRMEWEIDPAVRYISGIVTSYFNNKAENLDSVQVDLHQNMQVDSVIGQNQLLPFSHNNNKVTIRFAHPIQSGAIDSFAVYYKGIPPSSGFGSFETSNHGINETPVLWTLSEPYGAMEWWPCKQSLADKIDSVDIIVTTPEAYRTASNGVIVSDNIIDGKRKMHWKHRYPIATYLVAIAVTNYAYYSDTLTLGNNKAVEILNYVYPENLETAKSQTAVTAEIMALYNELIGEYPFADEKYGHAQFGWGGGMEHQTMSFMGSFSYKLIAHELAHQWFGDYITLNSWQDIWLNEGFATYLNALAYEHLKPEEWPDWKESTINNITNSDGGSVFVNDTSSVSRIFNYRLSYLKGAYLLHMLRWVLGDDNFYSGIRNYFNDSTVANGFASTNRFIHHMEMAGDTLLQEFLSDWYYGEGYPLYTLNYWHEANNQIRLTLKQTTSHNSVALFEMPVPVRLHNAGRTQSADFRLIQTQNEQTFYLNPGFEVAEIEFDPDRWLLSKTAQIVSVPQAVSAAVFKVYPNPAKNTLHISTANNAKITAISLYSVSGECVKKVFGNKQVLDISELNPGVYTLLLESDKEIYTEKIIKK